MNLSFWRQEMDSKINKIDFFGIEEEVSSTLSKYLIKGICEQHFLLGASNIEDAIKCIFKYVHCNRERLGGLSEKIFKIARDIPDEERIKYFVSDEYGVALKSLKDEITGTPFKGE